VLAAGSAVRLAAGPAAGRLADRLDASKVILSLCSTAAALIALGYLPARGLWLLFAVGVFHSAALAPLAPLSDTLALGAAAAARSDGAVRRGFEYGWVRGAGSAAFILGSVLSGQAVGHFGIASVVWLNAALLATAAFAALLVPQLPPTQDAARASEAKGGVRGVGALLRRPLYRRLVLVAAFDTFADLSSHEHPFDRIVFPDDTERFIHVPLSLDRNAIEQASGVRFSLNEIGIGVSTGPVVDFRLQDHIKQNATKGTVPLLYPGHFIGYSTLWPKAGMKSGNAINLNAQTKKWLYPNGFYTVVRRFSAKEERRRIVASVANPATFPNAPMLGFENHLNVFHEGKQGLPGNLAYGLTAFLNTTAVDDHFRRFNGHTQVNATDLRLMKYPSRAALIALGKWARAQSKLTQVMLDDQMTKLLE
jgi:MFS family permease